MGKNEKNYLSHLAQSLQDCCEEGAPESMVQLYEEFGTPQEIVNAYVSSLDTDYLIQCIQKNQELKNTLILSILSAFLFFLPAELQLNQLRIQAILSLGVSSLIVNILSLISIAACTYGIFSFSRSHLGNSKVRYWSAILWLPFAAAMVFIFANLFPITDPQLEATPVLGLLIIGAAILYPFYLLFVTYISGTSYHIHRNEQR
jgi:hypothetical protein